LRPAPGRAAYTISDADSLLTARELLRREAFWRILGGRCWPRHFGIAASRRRARVVTLVPDVGSKYLSKMFNDYWLMEQGIPTPERRATTDLIAPASRRRHGDH
jgi:cystathionine beta-synthase